jgi:hypothetical protein
MFKVSLLALLPTLHAFENRIGYRGEPPVALLHYWYSLMREKRQWRLDYLKALLRGLQVEIASERACTQVSRSRSSLGRLLTTVSPGRRRPRSLYC